MGCLTLVAEGAAPADGAHARVDLRVERAAVVAHGAERESMKLLFFSLVKRKE